MMRPVYNNLSTTQTPADHDSLIWSQRKIMIRDWHMPDISSQGRNKPAAASKNLKLNSEIDLEQGYWQKLQA
jgi:hypothetical protein